ncbi:MAG: Nramp family divalent metal transporter [Limnochordaceae bacterium]|nr:Nramp family divalent metal transporter [Limnochordaceae bacterium]
MTWLRNVRERLHTHPAWVRLMLSLSVIGPGLVTANADNDPGGITTYSTVGATFGYDMLWGLILVTISLVVIQEMAARLGTVTGRGLADLIREEFGVKMAFLAMLTLLLANLATTASEFAGMAASLEIFGVPRWVTIPITAVVVWWSVTAGSYRRLERIFLILAGAFITYILSGLLIRPDWGMVLRQAVVPRFHWTPSFMLLFVGMVGTTITPWMQFYLQASVVDKGLTVQDLHYVRWDVTIGSLWSDLVSFFIIVTTAATLFPHGIHIQTAEDAARALEPFAGAYATILFAVGLFAAGFLAAAILPLSTAYALSEAFGFERSVNRSWKEAPVFFWLFTSILGIGALLPLIPGLSLVRMMLFAQDVNGFLLPVILIFMLRLVNNRRLMGTHTNGPVYNVIVWVTVLFLVLLTLVLLGSTILPLGR